MRLFIFFFFNDTATTEIYTLSLHDALPISPKPQYLLKRYGLTVEQPTILTVARLDSNDRYKGYDKILQVLPEIRRQDRKSTRLNSSHANISYAVFCLKKKKKHNYHTPILQS